MSADRDDRSQPWRMVPFRDRLSVTAIALKNIYGGVMEGVKTSADRSDRDRSWPPVTAVAAGDVSCLFVSSREIIFRGAILISATPYRNSNRGY